MASYWRRVKSTNVIGFYFTEDSIKANSYSAEEVFANFTLDLISEKTLLIKESFSIFYGTCFTLCFAQPVKIRAFSYIKVKQNLELQVHVHDFGEEELVISR